MIPPFPSYFHSSFHFSRGNYRTRNPMLSIRPLLPGTGTDDKLPCVSPDEQIKRFTDHLTKYGIEVNTIWLDIEPHDDTARGGCRGWMWPPAQNKNLSAQWITAIRNDMQHSTRQWGIYAPNTEWVSHI